MVFIKKKKLTDMVMYKIIQTIKLANVNDNIFNYGMATYLACGKY